MSFNAHAWGAYYTSRDIASFLARWAIRSHADRVLEPSFGDGAFLTVAAERLLQLGGSAATLFGVEMRREAFDKAADNRLLPPSQLLRGDFLDIDPFPVDAVIGNPPYIRLRKLTADSAKKVIAQTENKGVHMHSSGSLWMPFIVHACTFLKPDGRLAFVLPYEMTYVKYAHPLWQFLCANFAALTICRTREDLFPDNEEKTIILLADGFGNTTRRIHYAAYRNKEDLLSSKTLLHVSFALEEILSGDKPFVTYLLQQEQRTLLASLKDSRLVTPVSQDCKFKIGYVSGDKHYFHPDRQTVSSYGISADNLLPAIQNSRQLRGLGLWAQAGSIDTSLYYPVQQSTGDSAYIRFGEESGVSGRYKCRKRNPWYLTPGITRPDLLLTVFTDQPVLVANSGQYTASNSLLCGYLTRPHLSAEDVLCRWYNSLTLLSVELQVHSLGGGVLVMIPGETDKIDLPCLVPQSRSDRQHFLAGLDKALQAGNTAEAYQLGDHYLLAHLPGCSQEQIDILHSALDSLRWWRKSARKKTNHGL